MSVIDLVRVPEVRLRVARFYDIEAPDADGMITFVSGYRLIFARHDPAYGEDLLRLREGVPLGQLRDTVLVRGGGGVAGRLLFLINRIAARCLLRYEVADSDNRVLATLMPQVATYVPRAMAPDSAARLVLSRFALIRREDELLLLESPRAGVRVALEDSAAALVMGFGKPQTVEAAIASLPEPKRRAAGILIGLLLGADLLIAVEEAEAITRFDEGGEALAQWEFHDLLFHSRSRRGGTQDPMGGIFPYIGTIEPLPAVRPPWPGERIGLARPDIAELAQTDRPFTAVQELRRSIRTYDEDKPLDLERLGEFLYRTVRLKHRDEIEVSNFFSRSTNFEITWRPYPTGGASYEIELYLVADRCAGLASGLYHYDVEAHALVQVRERTAEIEQMLEDSYVSTASQARGQVLLIMAARFQRVSWKYRSMAYSVILRNAGSLYQTMYLVATAMGIAPCGIGNGNASTFAQATGLDPAVEGPVGEFILGSLPK